MKRVWAILVGLFSLLILFNFGAGVLFEIPDNMPVVGNIDEATAALLLVWAIKQIFGKGGDGTPPPSIKKPPEKTVN
jgi:hypothetical protein